MLFLLKLNKILALASRECTPPLPLDESLAFTSEESTYETQFNSTTLELEK